LAGFDSSRLLDTGTYLFEVETGVGANLWSPGDHLISSFEFNFDLQPAATPEPTSMLLVGSGLIGLLLRRRSRNLV
jgi:hypothetical protein